LIERIEHEGKLHALIIRNTFEPENVQFVTPPDNPLQLGVMKRGPDNAVKPHIHKKTKKIITIIQEILVIQRGKVIARFYDEQNSEFASRELLAGDTILLVDGGHGFEFLDDTKLIEIKQGPYDGINQDKVWI